ncbi:TPA: deoxyguanosinetriphosphate triphosphohydrolase, partial [Klebsiella pneumoniae]|nr:deoxyguanosinetriphosphate triphosphohydrolase [Klebsiella pneumoniae]
YPNTKSTSNKFIYDDDYAFYQKLLEDNQLDMKAGEKTIDAQIMDLADEIAYAAHDLEDALSRNMVTIEDIEYEFLKSPDYNGALEHFNEIVNTSKKTASEAKLLKSSEEFAIIFRKELTSNIVNRLVMDIGVVESDSGYEELGYNTLQELAEGLKKLLFNVIMRKRNILTYEFKGNKIISDLYEFYNADDNYKFLSPELKSSLSGIDPSQLENKKARAVVDYISGMMDTFAVKEWETHCK